MISPQLGGLISEGIFNLVSFAKKKLQFLNFFTLE